MIPLKDLLARSNRLLVLGHQNADPDAVCSMIAFRSLYQYINPNGNVDMAADDVSRLASQVLDTFSQGWSISDTAADEYDLCVLLDTNSAFQLGEKLQTVPYPPENTLVVDHHEHNPEIDDLALHTVVQPDRSSTCEIVANLFDELDVPMTPATANLLLAGLLFDTRRFFYADPGTFKVALDLIDAGADYKACVHSLVIRPDRSERIARLTAASRLKIHLMGDWIVVTSRVRAFEASACRAILDLGADVAIVGGKPTKSLVRLSARSTREFSEATGLNLGTDVMEPLGSLIDGSGGGHANAAGANGTRNLSEALDKSVDLIRNVLQGSMGDGN